MIPLFEEKQRLPKLLIPVVLVPTLIIWAIGWLQGSSEQPIGNNPMSDSSMLTMVIGLGLILPLIILMVRGLNGLRLKLIDGGVVFLTCLECKQLFQVLEGRHT